MTLNIHTSTRSYDNVALPIKHVGFYTQLYEGTDIYKFSFNICLNLFNIAINKERFIDLIDNRLHITQTCNEYVRVKCLLAEYNHNSNKQEAMNRIHQLYPSCKNITSFRKLYSDLNKRNEQTKNFPDLDINIKYNICICASNFKNIFKSCV